MRRDDSNVAKEVTTMKMGGERPRRRSRLKWMIKVRSDLKERQLDPKLAQNREAWNTSVMTIDHGKGYDRQR